jgi:fatty-acyl-CoA synthase
MPVDQSYLGDATFLDALLRAGEVTSRGFTFLSSDLEESAYSFAELVAEARKRGRHLQRLGLRKGDRLAMVIPESEDFVLTFLGAVTVGVVPVPMYPPLALGKLDGYMETAERILSTSRARLLVTTKKVAPILWSLAGKAQGLEDIITVDRLAEPAPFDGEPVSVSPSDPCFLQFTSGSTSDPKGVVVTHGSLIHNARAIMFDGLQSTPETDKGVSWLPLYHDMGLIGFVLSPIVAHVACVFIQTMSFVKRPTVWMDMVSKYKGTITFAPNFAFALAAKYAARNNKEGFDVSRLRVVGCGAEPIHAATLKKFSEAFAPAGLSPHAIMPCYGMAEATLAMSFDPLDRGYSTLTIDRETYETITSPSPPRATRPRWSWWLAAAPSPVTSWRSWTRTGRSCPTATSARSSSPAPAWRTATSRTPRPPAPRSRTAGSTPEIWASCATAWCSSRAG